MKQYGRGNEEEEYDVEADFLRELAMLDTNEEKQEPFEVEYSAALNISDSDEESESTSMQEPESLKAWKEQLTRTERQLQEFEAELSAMKEDVIETHLSPAYDRQNEVDKAGAKISEEKAVHGPDVAEVHDQAHSPPNNLTQHVAEAIKGIQDMAKMKSDVIMSDDNLNAAGSSAQLLTQDEQSTGLTESGIERKALYEQFLREENLRSEEKEKLRQEERLRAEATALEAQAREAAQAAAEAQAAEQRSAAAEAKAEAMRMLRQAEEDAAAEEQMRLEEDRKALEDMREKMATEARERAAQLEGVMREVNEGLAAQARFKYFARRIQNAWLQYRGSMARQNRLAQITLMQALYRARAARKQYKQLAAERDVLRRLEEAAGKGHLEAAKAALAMAQNLGLGNEAQARVAEMEGQAAEATQRLSSAAAGGTFAVYRSALDAASKFSHLSGLVAESEHVFKSRKLKAEKELQAAVEGRPLQEVSKAIEAAAVLGTDATVLAAQLAAARQRDAAATANLQAAASARSSAFDLKAFQAAVERGMALGLRGDVAAARHAVEKRRAAFSFDLQRRAASASALEIQAMVVEARSLGLDSEVRSLNNQLAHQQGELRACLEAAAAEGDSALLDELMMQVEHVGLSAEVVAEVHSLMHDTRSKVMSTLKLAAASGSITEFRRARASAVTAGCAGEAEAVQRLLDSRRRSVAESLLLVLKNHWLDSQSTSSLPIKQLHIEGPNNELSLLEGVTKAINAVYHAGQSSTTMSNNEAVSYFKAAGEIVSGTSKPKVPSSDMVPAGERASRTSNPKVLSSDMMPAAARQPAEVLPTEITGVLKLGSQAALPAGGHASSPAAAAAAMWPALVACRELGLSFNASLALSVAFLHCRVKSSQDALNVGSVIVPLDYWGAPELSNWDQHDASCFDNQGKECKAITSSDAVYELGTKKLEEKGGKQTNDDNKEREASSLSWLTSGFSFAKSALGLLYNRFINSGSSATSIPSSSNSDSREAESKDLPEGRPASSTPAQPATAPAMAQRRLPIAVSRLPARQAQLPTSGSQALSKTLLVSLGGSGLESLRHLNLGLEKLRSLDGLDAWCPELQVLHAESNHLTRIDGSLSKLTHLIELSLKDNFLGNHDVGPPRPLHLPSSLRKLMLDSNSFHTLPTLQGGPFTHMQKLSLAHNCIMSLHPDSKYVAVGSNGIKAAAAAAAAAAPSLMMLPRLAPMLTTLQLMDNQLTNLEGLGNLSCLTYLNVSHNRLVSLEGLQSCPMLQEIIATGNQIRHPSLLPWPSCTARKSSISGGGGGNTSAYEHSGLATSGVVVPPYQVLRKLSLEQNAVSELWGLPPMPALQELYLQDNQISKLESMYMMPSLHTLDLSFNSLNDVSYIQTLAPLHALRNLKLNDNGFSTTPTNIPLLTNNGSAASARDMYLKAVQAAAPWLVELDGDALNADESARCAVRGVCGNPCIAISTMRMLRSEADMQLPVPAAATMVAAAAAVASPAPASNSSEVPGHPIPNSPLAAALIHGAPDTASSQQKVSHHDAPSLIHQCRLLTGIAAGSLGHAMPLTAPPYSITHQGRNRSWLEGMEEAWIATLPEHAAKQHAAEEGVAKKFTQQMKKPFRGCSTSLAPFHMTAGAASSNRPLPSEMLPAPVEQVIPSSMYSYMLDHRPTSSLSKFANLRSLTFGMSPAAASASSPTHNSVPLVVSVGTALFSPHTSAVTGVLPGAVWAGPKSVNTTGQGQYSSSSPGMISDHMDEAVIVMRHQHLLSATHAAAAAAAAAAATAAAAAGTRLGSEVSVLQSADEGAAAVATVPLEGELVLRPSYYLLQLEEVSAAAVTFQAVWRAKVAKRSATNLRSDHHRRMIAAAVLCIQSVWRGHRVRSGADLLARKEAAKAVKATLQATELERKTKAVVRIQAFARGLGVRRRLKAAVQAARYVDSDEEKEDFDGVDDILTGLNVVGEFLKAEEPAFMAAATAALASQQQQQQRQLGASAAPKQVLINLRPPALMVPDQPQAQSLPMVPLELGTRLVGGSSVTNPAPATVQAWVEAHPGPASPSTTVASQGGHGTGRQWDSSSQVPGSVAEEPSQMMSPTEGSTSVNKQQRYRVKLEALMVEWGFKDLATAELYYRRQRRQNLNKEKREAEARLRDPGLRFRKLQEVIEHRPQLRPEDVQRHAVKGPAVELHTGALQGPPSRGTGEKQQHGAGAAGIGNSGAEEVRRSQQLLQNPSGTKQRVLPPSSQSPGGGGGGHKPGAGKLQQVGRQVASADAALPVATSPLFLSGGQMQVNQAASVLGSGPAGPARSHSIGHAAWNAAHSPRDAMAGAAAPAARQPSLPPLPSQQRYSASVDNESDAASIYSAAVSEGQMRRRPLLTGQASIGKGVATGRMMGKVVQVPVGASSCSSNGRLVLPAMPGAPSVNRWVLSSDGDSAASPGGKEGSVRGVGGGGLGSVGAAVTRKAQLMPMSLKPRGGD